MNNNYIFMCTQLLLYFNQKSRDSNIDALCCLNNLVWVLLLGFFWFFLIFQEIGQKPSKYTLTLLQRKYQILKFCFRFKQLNSFWCGLGFFCKPLGLFLVRIPFYCCFILQLCHFSDGQEVNLTQRGMWKKPLEPHCFC